MASRFEHFMSGALGTPASASPAPSYGPAPVSGVRAAQTSGREQVRGAQESGRQSVEAAQWAARSDPQVRQTAHMRGLAEQAHAVSSAAHLSNRVEHARNRAAQGDARLAVDAAQSLVTQHREAAAGALGVPVGTAIPDFLHQNKMTSDPVYRAAVDAGKVAEAQHAAAKTALQDAGTRVAESGTRLSRTEADTLLSGAARTAAVSAHEAAKEQTKPAVAQARTDAREGVLSARQQSWQDVEGARTEHATAMEEHRAGTAAQTAANAKARTRRAQKVSGAGLAIKALEGISAEGERQRSMPRLSTTWTGR